MRNHVRRGIRGDAIQAALSVVLDTSKKRTDKSYIDTAMGVSLLLRTAGDCMYIFNDCKEGEEGGERHG